LVKPFLDEDLEPSSDVPVVSEEFSSFLFMSISKLLCDLSKLVPSLKPSCEYMPIRTEPMTKCNKVNNKENVIRNALITIELLSLGSTLVANIDEASELIGEFDI
jgi:hypothetical protein